MPRKNSDTIDFNTAEKDQEIERLAAENAALREGVRELNKLRGDDGEEDSLDRSEGFPGLVRYCWCKPEGRCAVFSLPFFARMLLADGWPMVVNVLCGLSALILFVQWNHQEYLRHGLIQLFMKWAFFATGVYAAWIAYTQGNPNAYPLHPVYGCLTLLLVVLLTMSKLTQNLAKRMSEIMERVLDIPILAWVKGWLV